MSRHKFKNLIYKGKKVEIDIDIVSLLKKMWALGINTDGSCHKDCNFNCEHSYKELKNSEGLSYLEVIPTKNCFNNIWISFESAKDVEKLYNILAPSKDDPMYIKMNCNRFIHNGFMMWEQPKDSWTFNFILSNKKNKFSIIPQITFPRKHLKYVEKKLRLVLKNK